MKLLTLNFKVLSYGCVKNNKNLSNSMKYRTIENSANVQLRRERRSTLQSNEFPLEDLKGNTVIKNRRVILEEKKIGLEVTETKISQAEFQEYFDNLQNPK